MKEIRWLIVGYSTNGEMVFYNYEYDFFNKSFLNADCFKHEETAKGIIEEIDKSQHYFIKDIKIIKTEIELKVL